MPHQLMLISEVAEYLRVSVQTIRAWVAQGKLPKPIRLAKKLYWRLPEVDACLSQQGAGQQREL
jgi:predicted DNA-binding transcriptional regulator AlpA